MANDMSRAHAVDTASSGASWRTSLRRPYLPHVLPSRSRHVASALAALFALTLTSRQVAAATYFVDPSRSPCATADAGAGSSPSTAWCTPPGSRLANDSGFLRSQWGGITTGAKVQCGDVILLKPSSTQGSTQGGAWRFDPSYYAASCGGNPITVRIATPTEWLGAAAGNFTIDATGVTSTNVAFIGSGGPTGIIAVNGINGLTVAGLNTLNRLEVKNISANAISSTWTCGVLVAQQGHCAVGSAGCETDNQCGSSGPCNGITLNTAAIDWFYIHDNTGGQGVCMGGVSQSRASHGIIQRVAHAGISCGLGNDIPCQNIGWVDIQTDHAANAPVGGASPCGGNSDAFFPERPKLLYIIDSTAHDSGCNGANVGTATHSETQIDRTLFRNFSSYNNGQLKMCLNGANSGLLCSVATDCPGGTCSAQMIDSQGGVEEGGDHRNDNLGELYTVVQNSRFYRNGRSGVDLPHSAGSMEVWNSNVFRNGALTSEAELWWNRVGGATALRNIIHVKRSASVWDRPNSGNAIPGFAGLCKASCGNVGAGCNSNADCSGCNHSQSTTDCVLTQCFAGCSNPGAYCAVDAECTGCGGPGTCAVTFDKIASVDYSLFQPQIANTETISPFDFQCMTGCTNSGASCASDGDCSGCSTGTQGWCRFVFSAPSTYASPAKMFSFAGNHNKIGAAYNPQWALGSNCDGGTYDFTQCDFSIPATSPVVDAGTFFLLTKGAQATPASVVPVKASSARTSSDPTAYFIAPSSYLGAVGDVIQISGANCTNGVSRRALAGRAQITSMTSGTITLDDTCTWSDGAGVHLPWAGAAPDIGAYEFGLGGLAAPTLISVQPVVGP